MQKLSLALAATALLALAPLGAQAAHQPGAARAPLMQHVDLGAATVSASKANFRTEPSTTGKSKVISQLKRGDKLTAIEKSKDGKWMKVKVGDQTGWIIASFIKVG